METKRTKPESGGGVSLPEDIIFDVLARLPAKTLYRLRCVCKGWCALISDPAFVAAQRSRVADDPHLIGVFLEVRHLPEVRMAVRMIDMDGNVVKAFEITSTPQQLPTRLDLICTDGDGQSPLHGGGMIIDPAAGRAFGAFGKDPWNTTNTYSTSFGRATPSGVFKVLRLQRPSGRFYHDPYGSDHQQLCEIATIMDGSSGAAGEPLTWRQKSAPPFVTAGRSGHKAIVNGVVYFMPHELEVNQDDDVAPSWNRIAAFDLEREEWKADAINGPAFGDKEEDMSSITLVELKGTLALVVDVERVDDYKFTSIWLLIDPNKSVWVKEYLIQMPTIEMITTPTIPLGVLVDGRILLWSGYFDIQGIRQEVVQFYDPSTKAFTDFITDFMKMEEGFRYTMVLYTGSLLS